MSNIAQVIGLTKKFGDKVAVNNISFDVPAGRVVGFLGPNGAGKTTTMRCLLGLDAPTSGKALIDGKPYSSLKHPLNKVGAMIDAKAFHKSRSAKAHLQYIAAAAGIPKKRVEECLEIAGIASVAKKKAGSYSLGMAQRIGIATALLGNPELLILDEPVNGLDPEGVIWVRELCREYASSGKSVLISSHLMSEVAQTVDDLIIIGKGEIIKTGTVADIIDSTSRLTVEVSSADNERLSSVLKANLNSDGATNVQYLQERGVFAVRNFDTEKIGQLALQNQLVLTHLMEVKNTLEESFLKLTADAVEYHTHSIAGQSNVPVGEQIPAHLNEEVK